MLAILSDLILSENTRTGYVNSFGNWNTGWLPWHSDIIPKGSCDDFSPEVFKSEHEKITSSRHLIKQRGLLHLISF